jgi:hypothetical protein
MPAGAAHRFEDDVSQLSSANFNGLDVGGNVYVSPNGGLNVRVTALEYQRFDISAGTVTHVSYAGAATDQGVAASNTNYVFLDATGALTINQTSFPADSLRLAEVVTDATSITAITDRRPKLSQFVA